MPAAHILERHILIPDGDQLLVGQETHPRREQALHLIVPQLEPGAGGDLLGHLHHRDVVARPAQQFRRLQAGHAAAHHDDPFVLDVSPPVDDVRGRADLGPIHPGQQFGNQRAGARGKEHRVGAFRQDLLRCRRDAGPHRHAQQAQALHQVLNAPMELAFQVAGRGRVHLAAGLLLLFQHLHIKAAPGQRLSGHEPRRAGAEDQDLAAIAVPRQGGVRRLPAHRRVQGALAVEAHRRPLHKGTDAVEAADAAADLLRVAGGHLVDPVGVADKAAGGADKVLHALLQLPLRLLGRAHVVGRDHGDGDHAFDLFCQIGPPAGLKRCGLQPGVIHVVAGGGHVDGVHAQFFQALGDPLSLLQAVALPGFAEAGVHLVRRQPDDQRIVPSAAQADPLDDLPQEAQAVFKAAAVFVRPLVGVGAQKLLDQIAVAAVELHRVHPGLLAAHRRLDKIRDQLFDLPPAHGVDAGGAVIGQFPRRGGLYRLADALGLQAQQQGRALKQRVQNLREALHHRDHQRQRVDGAGIALPARMMQLQAELGPLPVDTLGEGAHGLDLIILAHGELGKGGGRAHIVDAADARDDQAHAAPGPRLVIGHQLLGRTAVGLAEAHLRRGHHHPVSQLHRADLSRAQQQIIGHGTSPFRPARSCARSFPARARSPAPRPAPG